MAANESVVRKSVSFAELLHEKGDEEEEEDHQPLESRHRRSRKSLSVFPGRSATTIQVTSMTTESNAVMASSMPNIELSNGDLDKLSDRLGKFKSSKLPKPEISPKPAHLVAQLAKHKIPSPNSNSNTSERSDKKSGSPSNGNGTSSMLKSTLKRMTKLTASPVSRSSSFKDPQEVFGKNSSNRTNSLKNPPMLHRSNSLKKVRNKDMMVQSTGNYSLSRSGTSGTLDRTLGNQPSNNGVKRTPSMTTVRRYRDRDLNVKLSRGVQTQLTKDTVDEPDFADDGNIPTSVDFTVYLPDLFGGDTDQVETHVSEPTEPVDVRKNRQLTLDNMKLHRELEKMKQMASEHEFVKKELRSMRTKYEEEQKARNRLEHAMDMQNKKVKQIVEGMDSVEREFEKRDANIYDLEGQVKIEKSKVENLEAELQKASRIIESQKSELYAARKMQKTLVEQCEHVEGESKELQEFLQIEKLALSETLKDAENEIEKLKQNLQGKENEVKEAEERCGHLVRLGEQRHQELLTSQQQFKSFSETAKSMLISQGTELYQFSSRLSVLQNRLAATLFPGLPAKEKSPLKDAETVKQEIEAIFNQLQSSNEQQEEKQSDINTDSLQNLSVAIEKRRRSESMIAVNGLDNIRNTQNGDNNLVWDNFDKLDKMLENLVNNDIHQNGTPEQSDQNDLNQCNTDETKGSSNGHESIEDMRAKFLKHQQIYKANYEQAESEIKRMDELYHDLIENVLKTLTSASEAVESQPDLKRLKDMLENEAAGGESLSSLVTSPEVNGCKNGKVNLESLTSSQEQENLSL